MTELPIAQEAAAAVAQIDGAAIPSPQQHDLWASQEGKEAPASESKTPQPSQEKAAPPKVKSIFPDKPAPKVKAPAKESGSDKETAKGVTEKEKPKADTAPAKEKPVKEKKGSFISDEDVLAKELEAELGLSKPEDKPAAEDKPSTEKPVADKEVKTTFNFKSIKEKTGVEADTEEQLIEKINELKKGKAPVIDVPKLKATQSAIGKIQSALNLDNTDLVKNDLIWNGMSEKDAEEQISEMLDDGDKEINKEARKVRAKLGGYLDHYNKEYNNILDTPIPAKEEAKTKEPIADVMSALDKVDTIFGVPSEKFSEEISSIKSGNPNSVYDLLSKAQLAEAIVGYQSREKIQKAIGDEGFKRGYKNCFETQVKGKILNHSPITDSKAGKQPLPKNPSKPDAGKFMQGIGGRPQQVQR